MANYGKYKKPRTLNQQIADFRKTKHYKMGYDSPIEVEKAKMRAANWGFFAQIIDALLKVFR